MAQTHAPLALTQTWTRTMHLSLAMCGTLRTPTPTGEETAPPEACRKDPDTSLIGPDLIMD